MKQKKEKNIPKEEGLSMRTSTMVPVKLQAISSKNDPCFGTQYDLSTTECKLCGDSELCCIKMADYLGKSRQDLEKENHFVDIEEKVDKVGLKKYYRKLKREDKTKKEILGLFKTKYELTRDEARTMYKEFSNQ